MFVLGMPLNKVAPALPGCTRSSDFSMVNTSFMNAVGFIGIGNKIGQKAADGHSGTTRVPLALQLSACRITHGIRYTGGHNQLLSLCQSQVKASTASVPGFQNQELNLSS